MQVDEQVALLVQHLQLELVVQILHDKHEEMDEQVQVVMVIMVSQ